MTLGDEMTPAKMLELLGEEFKTTVEHAEWLAKGSKGMQVPFHGEFAAAVHNPSVIIRFKWWVREIEKCLSKDVELDRGEADGIKVKEKLHSLQAYVPESEEESKKWKRPTRKPVGYKGKSSK